MINGHIDYGYIASISCSVQTSLKNDNWRTAGQERGR